MVMVSNFIHQAQFHQRSVLIGWCFAAFLTGLLGLFSASALLYVLVRILKFQRIQRVRQICSGFVCLPSALAWFCASVRLHQQASRGNKTCWHLAADKSPEQASNPKPDFNGLIIQRFLLGSRWNSCSNNGWNPARLDDWGFRSFSVWSLTSCRRPEVSSDASSESVLPKVLEDFCILAGRIRGQLCVMVNGNIRTGSTNWSLSLCLCRYVQGGNSIRLYRHGCTYWLLLRILRPTSGDGCGIDLGCLGGESSVTWQPDPIICFFSG